VPCRKNSVVGIEKELPAVQMICMYVFESILTDERMID
jgi:hypothetical protein